ncbi:hypothetical protein EWM64_g8671 [Hericium alpestre]|uniref:Uncharacterized protein n=1 Tax=Hericium alpestre TaxID=135208 RepID=A0A4Y9ZP96_9AGAM|nr:hypothetical protein EWM64_g8671 [Hericium alpestre]
MHLFLYVFYTCMLCALAPPVLRYTHRALFIRPTRTIMTSSLQDFAKAGLTAIYTADAEHFDAAFNAFVSPNAEIHINEQKLSRDDFRARVRKNEMTQSVHVEFPNAIEVPRKQEEGAAAGPEEGLVGMFYKVTRALKIRVRVSPMQNIEEVTLQARIEQDPSVQADEAGDQRRLTFMWATAINFRPPINFNPAAHAVHT